MSIGKNDKNSQPELPKEVKFHYIKSQYFRALHVDGFFGGVTPNLDIHIAIFNERNPIPQESTYRITDAGKLGDEIMDQRKGREGIVREVEADLILDLASAQSLLDWLKGKIKFAKDIVEKKKKGRES